LATNYTTVSDVASAVKTKFQQRLLEKLKGKVAFTKFASKGKMARGEGDTVRWNRLIRLAKQTSFNLDEYAMTGTEKEFVSNMVEASIGYMGDVVALTKGAKLTSIIDDPSYVEEVSDQIIRSTEYVGLKQISRYSLHHRVDNDSTYEVNADVTTATSTTEWRSTDLTQADDFWGESTTKVGYCCGTNPEAPNYDNASLITDFATTNDVVTTLAFPQNNSTDTNFHVVRGTGITAADKMSIAALARVAGNAELLQWKPFEGGLFRGFMHPGQHADLRTDSTYTNLVQYVEGLKELGRYKVFRVYGIEFVVVPEVFREDADGTENTAGAVYNAPIFGADSYNITRWTDGNGEFGVQTNFISKPDSSNYWGLMNFISWHCMAAVATLRATNIMSLMTGATAQAVVL